MPCTAVPLYREKVKTIHWTVSRDEDAGEDIRVAGSRVESRRRGDHLGRFDGKHHQTKRGSRPLYTLVASCPPAPLATSHLHPDGPAIASLPTSAKHRSQRKDLRDNQQKKHGRPECERSPAFLEGQLTALVAKKSSKARGTQCASSCFLVTGHETYNTSTLFQLLLATEC